MQCNYDEEQGIIGESVQLAIRELLEGSALYARHAFLGVPIVSLPFKRCGLQLSLRTQLTTS
jgi:hypothetical protein